MNVRKNKAVDDYISGFPLEVQWLLNCMRDLILTGNVAIEESLSYGMPAYRLNKKPLVCFAAYKKHIGFYATPSGHEAFKDELASFKKGKGSVQFVLNQPLPVDVVQRIIDFRIAENLAKG